MFLMYTRIMEYLQFLIQMSKKLPKVNNGYIKFNN